MGRSWVIVAGASLGVRVIEVGFAQHSAAWVDSNRLVLVGENRRVILDVRSGEQSPVEGLVEDAFPRIDVTGRVDVERLKAAQAPRFRGPIQAEARDELLESERVYSKSLVLRTCQLR